MVFVCLQRVCAHFVVDVVDWSGLEWRKRKKEGDERLTISYLVLVQVIRAGS